jgi:hypothetical protein
VEEHDLAASQTDHPTLSGRRQIGHYGLQLSGATTMKR